MRFIDKMPSAPGMVNAAVIKMLNKLRLSEEAKRCNTVLVAPWSISAGARRGWGEGETAGSARASLPHGSR